MNASAVAWRDVPCENPANAPCERWNNTCAVWRDRLYVFGGWTGSTNLNDLYEFSFPQKRWSVVPAVGTVPSPRWGHVGVVCNDSYYVFGGYDGRSYFNDLFAFNFVTRQWRAVQVAGGSPPTPRGFHHAVAYGNSMFCFGGYDHTGTFQNDLHEFDLETRVWSRVHVTGDAPSARGRASLVVVNNRCILFGGYCPTGLLNDVHAFDFAQRQWSTLQADGPAPSPRSDHVAVVHGNAMYVFGGMEDGVMNDLHKLTISSALTSTWEQVAFKGPPPPERFNHTAILHDSNLIVFGGRDVIWQVTNDFFEISLGPPTIDQTDIPASKLVADLRRLVNNPTMSDVTFVVEGQAIHAHKNLCMRCDYFHAMLSGEMLEGRAREIPIHDVRHAVFVSLLEYLYTDEIRVPVESATELLVLAEQYGVDRLKRICERELLPTSTVANVATRLLTADLHNAAVLREHCVAFIVDNFDAVSKTPGFLEMSRNNVELNLELLQLRTSTPTHRGGASLGQRTVAIPESTLLTDLRHLVNDQVASDVTFIVEGTPVFAHKNLCMRCDYFKTKFSGHTAEPHAREIVVNDVRLATFVSFLEFVYTDEIAVSAENVMELIVMADRYGAGRLKQICQRHLQQSLCVDNAATMLLAADALKVDDLRAQCLAFIVSNFDAVSKTKAFVDMSRTNVELNLEILQRR